MLYRYYYRPAWYCTSYLLLEVHRCIDTRYGMSLGRRCAFVVSTTRSSYFLYLYQYEQYTQLLHCTYTMFCMVLFKYHTLHGCGTIQYHKTFYRKHIILIPIAISLSFRLFKEQRENETRIPPTLLSVFRTFLLYHTN